MNDKTQMFTNEIYRVIEDKVLANGLEECQEILKKLMVKERMVQRFGQAFNDAILRSVTDDVNNVLIKYKIPQKWNKSQHDELSSLRTLISWKYKGNEIDAMKYARLTVKSAEKDFLQTLIEKELQNNQLVKQRLQFLMISFSEKKSEIKSVMDRLEQMNSIINSTNDIQKNIVAQILDVSP